MLAAEVLVSIVPTITLIIGVLFSIFTGVATPSESGAVGVFGALLLTGFNWLIDRVLLRDGAEHIESHWRLGWGELKAAGCTLVVKSSEVAPINAVGAFPTRNARSGQFEHATKISGETMAATIKQRGGKTTHKGCSGCIINCSYEYVDKKGNYVTSSLEYETIWAMGGMIGNDKIKRVGILLEEGQCLGALIAYGHLISQQAQHLL